jgi:hypothetical protein
MDQIRDEADKRPLNPIPRSSARVSVWVIIRTLASGEKLISIPLAAANIERPKIQVTLRLCDRSKVAAAFAFAMNQIKPNCFLLD